MIQKYGDWEAKNMLIMNRILEILTPRKMSCLPVRYRKTANSDRSVAMANSHKKHNSGTYQLTRDIAKF